jgi:hypothetical protein
VAVKGEAAAIAHAARRYVEQLSSDRVLVKIDFSNAFTRSTEMLYFDAVARHIPSFLLLSSQRVLM